MILTKDMPLPLTESGRALGTWIGISRERAAQARGISSPPFNGMNSETNNIGAAIAEVAVAVHLNLFPDLNFDNDRGWDLRLHTGQTIDVKWNLTDVDLLVALSKREKPCDLYLLVCGAVGAMTFGGWTYGRDIVCDASIRSFKTGPCFYRRGSTLATRLTDKEFR